MPISSRGMRSSLLKRNTGWPRSTSDRSILSLVNRLHNLVDMNRVHYIFSSFEENNLSDSLRLLAAIDSLQRRTIDPYRLEIDVPGQLLAHDPQPGSIVSEREIPAIGGLNCNYPTG